MPFGGQSFPRERESTFAHAREREAKLVIPAKAGIYSANLGKCPVVGLDSRFRGNDRRGVTFDGAQSFHLYFTSPSQWLYHPRAKVDWGLFSTSRAAQTCVRWASLWFPRRSSMQLERHAIEPILSVNFKGAGPVRQKLLSVVGGALEHVLLFDQLNALYHETLHLQDTRHFHEKLLEA